MTSKNILILVRSLYIYAGGVEKMSIEIANELSSRGYKISILTWDNDIDYALPLDFHKIDKRISLYKLNIGSIKNKSNLFTRIKRILKIRKIILNQEINILIAFVEGIYWNALLASIFTKIKIIASERVSPERFKYISLKKYKFIIMNLFRFAYKITVQFPSYVDYYPEYLRRKIKVIPNSVSDTNLDKDFMTKKEKIILCVSRCSFQKNIPCLLKAFSLIKDKQNWKIFIITDNNQEHPIDKLVDELNIKEDVKIIEPVSDISQFYLRSSIFCLPSYYEGFPNALAEAMSFGSACIGFENCSGVNELIEHNVTGLLAKGIDNKLSLKNVINKLMNDKNLRIELGTNARKFVSRYNKSDVFLKWEEIIS